MFTGIIQDTGKVINKTLRGDSIVFSVKPEDKNFTKIVKIGDSISINGACMTVVSKKAGIFQFTTVKESLSKTNLSSLKLYDLINLEKAMTLSSKLDGHIVQGHVDCTGKVNNIKKLKDSWEFYFEFSSKFKDFIINIGSITVNGVSLTIAEIVKESSEKIIIKIAIIPHTFENTNFSTLELKDEVNLEFDMLGKYVNRIYKNSIHKK